MLGEALFVVLSGRARVTEAQAGRRPLPGDFFGELSALDGGQRSANVVAETPVRVLRLFRHTLLELLRASRSWRCGCSTRWCGGCATSSDAPPSSSARRAATVRARPGVGRRGRRRRPPRSDGRGRRRGCRRSRSSRPAGASSRRARAGRASTRGARRSAASRRGDRAPVERSGVKAGSSHVRQSSISAARSAIDRPGEQPEAERPVGHDAGAMFAAPADQVAVARARASRTAAAASRRGGSPRSARSAAGRSSRRRSHRTGRRRQIRHRLPRSPRRRAGRRRASAAGTGRSGRSRAGPSAASHGLPDLLRAEPRSLGLRGHLRGHQHVVAAAVDRAADERSETPWP